MTPRLAEVTIASGCGDIYCESCSLRNQIPLSSVPRSLVSTLDDGFLLWDHGSWKPNSPWVKCMWQFSISFQERAVVTLTQVTSVLVSCWPSVYRKCFKVLFIVNQKETTLWKKVFAMKWKFYIYVHFILTFKKTKGLYLQRKCIPWTGVIIPKLVLIPGIGREFFWCILVHGYEELNSCISAVLPAL